MTTPITTGVDTYASRYPLLAEMTYKGASSDTIYESFVTLKDSSWSPIPDGVETHSMGGLGPMQKRGETTPFSYDTPGPAGTKKSYYSNYALAVYFTENLIQDALYNLIDSVAEDLGRSYNLARNIQTGAIYDDAFTGSILTGPDGQPLLSNSHTTFLASSSTLRTNILPVAAPLSYTAAQGLLTVMRRQTDERGYPKPALMNNGSIDVGIAPEAQFEAAKIFDTGSAYDPDSNKNAINVLKSNSWRVIPNPYFTSTKNWFFMTPNERDIVLVDKQPLVTDSFQDEYMKGMQYDVRARWVHHPRSWENTYGSNG